MSKAKMKKEAALSGEQDGETLGTMGRKSERAGALEPSGRQGIGTHLGPGVRKREPACAGGGPVGWTLGRKNRNALGPVGKEQREPEFFLFKTLDA